eukprot:gene5302-7365_t
MIKSSGNLNELEQKINILERANFDLKMQLYYLQRKSSPNSTNSGNNDSNNNIVNQELIVSLMEDKQMMLLSMKDENDALRRRIVDMEAEILQLKLLIDRQNHELEKAKQNSSVFGVNHNNPNINLNSSILDENRKREKIAVAAIAEHDGAIIKQLQGDIRILHKQHEQDKQLVDSITDKLSEQKYLLVEKEKKILEQNDMIVKYLATIETLNDKIMNLEVQLSKQFLTFSSQSIDNIMPPQSLPTSQRQDIFSPTNKSPRRVVQNDANFSKNAASPSNKSNNNINNNNSNNNNNNKANIITIQGKSYMMLDPDEYNNNINNNSNGKNNIPSNNNNSNNNGNYYINPSDMESLRHENIIIKDQLERQLRSIINQEEALNRIQSSSVELSLIDKEEIKRLGVELDKCIDEKEKIMKKYQTLEVKFELLKQSSLQTIRNNLASLIPQNGVDEYASLINNLSSNEDQLLSFLAASGDKTVYSSLHTNYPRFIKNNNGNDPVGTPRNKNKLETEKVLLDKIEEQTQLIEMYRQRESELLTALEGVINRCQELETLNG